jgi:Cbb3-type cytochrome oxidase, cytochrome c subunit
MNFHTDHHVVVGFAGIGYLILSLIIAVLPAFEAQKTQPLETIVERDALEEKGRVLYLKEGCAFCHTQFVRALSVDEPYGRGSVAGDYALEDPPLLGTQRTGPDLSNTGVRQPSDVWNLIHLYNPRAVVPDSVMPSYPWYFIEKAKPDKNDVVVPVPDAFKPKGISVVAHEDALAIVAYLKTLKQASLSP